MTSFITVAQRPLVAIALLLATATVPAPAAPAQASATLRVGVIPGDFAAQPYYAQDEGFFAKAGLHVEIVPVQNGPAAAAAVASDSLDFAYSNVMSLAVAHQHGLPFVIVASANLYAADAAAGGMLSVKRSSPIVTAKDLNGKTIAVGGLNNITQLAARAWIDANGGDSNSVHWVEIQVSAIAPAVLSTRVDAAVMDPGVYPSLGRPDDPIRVIGHVYDAVGRTFAAGAWFTTRNWASSHPAETHAFAAALAAAGVWANGHHHESAAVLGKYLEESPAAIDALLRYAYGTAPSAPLLQPSIDLAAKYGLIPASFPATELFASS